jgi:F0F1-type ATP synthase membrane subunit c/vacuolar-type H+-ATPase subunit K
MNKLLPVLLLLSIGVFVTPLNVLAQAPSDQAPNPNQVKDFVSSLGIAQYLPVQGDKVEDGDVVSFGSKGYFLTNTPYDQFVVGVVSSNPAVAISTEGEGKKYAVVPSGDVYVKVSTVNGKIEKGDLLTSSSVPGVAMKATKTGFVLGNALESYTSADSSAVGKIAVNLNVHFFYNTKQALNKSLSDVLNLSALAFSEQPSVVFRYIAAAIILLSSIVAAFVTFGRVARKGIEALGRNPLAGKLIQVGIFFNVMMSIFIVAAGATIAFFIIRI